MIVVDIGAVNLRTQIAGIAVVVIVLITAGALLFPLVARVVYGRNGLDWKGRDPVRRYRIASLVIVSIALVVFLFAKWV